MPFGAISTATEESVDPPNMSAGLWWSLAKWIPDEMRLWLEQGGRLPEQESPMGMERVLLDMRWVYSHNESADRTEGQRSCRLMLKKRPVSFFSLLMRLERNPGKSEASALAAR